MNWRISQERCHDVKDGLEANADGEDGDNDDRPQDPKTALKLTVLGCTRGTIAVDSKRMVSIFANNRSA